VADLWQRAQSGVRTAAHLVLLDPDASASRSYFAAFHAVSAYLLHRGASLTKHSAVEAAVHRDLVHAGLWPRELGADYSSLAALRSTGDYGGIDHVSEGDARQALAAAQRIVEGIRRLLPALSE
jgi:uncharacterized protein (UPF0332 family)